MLHKLRPRSKQKGHAVSCGLVNSDCVCRLFVTGSHDSTATVWDYDTLMPIKSHVNADWTVNAVGFSHDSQYLALGGDENEIKISDTYTGVAPLYRLHGIQSLHAGLTVPKQRCCLV